MMTSPALGQVEELIPQLSYLERLSLIERLAQELQNSALPLPPPDFQQQIALMAADPAMQAELAAIELEFAVTESDGLPN
jgi:hypothetical protein